MGDYIYVILRAALFAFAIFTILTDGISLTSAALAGEFWHIIFRSVAVMCWVYLAFENAPPWWDSREHKSIVAMDDAL